MKTASAKKSVRATPAKSQRRAVKAAAVTQIADVADETAFDTATTVVAESFAPAAGEALSDEAYVEQLLAASDALPADRPVADSAPAALPVVEECEVVVAEPVLKAGAEAACDATVQVTLPPQCLLRDASHLKESLLPRLNDAAVAIDAHQVERIDTAAMQVLLAFVRDRHSQQRVVEWLGLNETFVDSARLLGIDAMLGLPATTAAA